MLMTLTICIESNKREFNIQVNRKQKIQDTIEVLIENNIINEISDINNIQLKSVRNATYINELLSYEQENIYTGDKIIIIHK